MSSAAHSDVSDVCGSGRRITALPATRAGSTSPRVSVSGKFHRRDDADHADRVPEHPRRRQSQG